MLNSIISALLIAASVGGSNNTEAVVDVDQRLKIFGGATNNNGSGGNAGAYSGIKGVDLGESRAIVVGSGLAGLSAALELVRHDVSVRVLEQSVRPGGNSIKASSGINGAPTKFQPVEHGPDDAFFADTLRSAGTAFASSSPDDQRLRTELISVLSNHSASAIDWLTGDIGIDLSTVSQLGGHSFPRTHRGGLGQKPPGASIIGALLAVLNENPLFELVTNAKVSHLLVEDDHVAGVQYQQGEGRAESIEGPVIFASGGFAGDAHGMLAEYRPDLLGYPSTNDARKGTQSILTEVGAGLVDMDRVQVHPTGFVDPKNPWAPVKILAAEMLRGEGGILVDQAGRRFVNELDTREKVTSAIIQAAGVMNHQHGSDQDQEGAAEHQWDVRIVLDEATANATASHLGFYQWKGLIRKATVGELGDAIAGTACEYSDIVQGSKQDPFQRQSFGHWSLTTTNGTISNDTVLYIGHVTPVVHFTMGGATINERAQVLDTKKQPIAGLWAAGEITGGIHGDNRLGGSSLLECVVFGRIAAAEVASYIKLR